MRLQESNDGLDCFWGSEVFASIVLVDKGFMQIQVSKWL